MPQKQLSQPHLDHLSIRTAYRMWAPIYDYSFGAVSTPGRRRAVAMLNQEKGRILEIGIGTGLSLPRYKPGLEVTGIDLSPEMLAKAAQRLQPMSLRGRSLALMDASRLAFADDIFDAAAVMYVMTVVPDPAAVMAEMRRVLRPGGTAIVVNHFSRETGIRGAAERWLARFSRRLGWHPVFPLAAVTGAPGFSLVQAVPLPPLGLFTLLQLRKSA